MYVASLTACCIKCGEPKKLDGFGKHKAWKDGRDRWCIDCRTRGDRVEYLEKSPRLGLVCWFEKACRICLTVQPLEQFPRKASGFDGRDTRCRACEVQRRQTYYAELKKSDPEAYRRKVLAPALARQKKRVDAAGSAYTLGKRYRKSEAFKEMRRLEGLIRSGTWSPTSGLPPPPRKRETDPEHRRLDFETKQRAQLMKRLRKPSSPTAGMTDAERYRWRYENDPSFVIHARMKTAIRKALLGKKAGRKWESIVGYTLAELMGRLSRTMPAGCTLGDIAGGRYHIDHIVPKSIFDAADPDQLRAAWSLSNLRLITAEENLRKGAKLFYLP